MKQDKRLIKLWSMYSNLKHGKIKNLAVNENLLLGGNLSALIGYGPKIFNIPGIKKHIPIYFGKTLSSSPLENGRGVLSANIRN